MIIEIDENLADESDTFKWLDAILRKIEDGWHVWHVSGLETFTQRAWIRDRGPTGAWVDQIFIAATRRSAWASSHHPHGRRIRVTTATTTRDALGPEAAARLAERPFVVLVENRRSDGCFLKRVVKELAPALAALWGRNSEPVLFDSVGGKGEMRKEVEDRCRQASVRPRLAVVVDSDRRVPDKQPSQEAQRLERECRKYGIPCWVLAKREAENYLPRSLLEARPDAGSEHRARVEAWSRLWEDQKDCYDMKKGLSSDPNAELFDDLTGPDRVRLAQGFGPNVDDCWKQWNVKNIAKELRDRGRGDLERGIDLLCREI